MGETTRTHVVEGAIRRVLRIVVLSALYTVAQVDAHRRLVAANDYAVGSHANGSLAKRRFPLWQFLRILGKPKQILIYVTPCCTYICYEPPENVQSPPHIQLNAQRRSHARHRRDEFP